MYVLELFCHTALWSGLLFSPAGDPYRHNRALWLLLSVMWLSRLDQGDFTPGTGNALSIYTCEYLNESFHPTLCVTVLMYDEVQWWSPVTIPQSHYLH